jgi:RHS repeat-associated protein
VWRWDQGEPFGSDVPNNNPSGAGAFEFNLRFPGQHFDRETNLVYNTARDYDSTIGRYIESDPIGLDGGLNPFLYVKADPLAFQDPLGLKICSKCGEAAKVVRGILENFNRSTYKVPCKMSCSSLWRGNGRTIIDIVINDDVYQLRCLHLDNCARNAALQTRLA